MTRSVPEWIGKTPDTAIPARVALRNFEAHGGVCHISGQKIRPGDQWDTDHVIALINGGENRESNLAPALRKAHRTKTAVDVKIKAKNARGRKKHLSIHRPKSIMPGSKSSKWKRTIDGQTIPREEST